MEEGETAQFVIRADNAQKSSELKLNIKALPAKITINEYLLHERGRFDQKIDHVFIELYNPNSIDIDLKEYYLYNTLNKFKLRLSGTIKAHSYYVLVSEDDFIEALSADLKITLAEAQLLFEARNHKTNKYFHIMYKDTSLDSVNVISQFSLHSYERAQDGVFTQNACIEAVKALYKPKGAEINYCATVGLPNENRKYLSPGNKIHGKLKTEEGKEYYVPHDTEVGKGAELELAPGVTLKFAGYSSLKIYGTLHSLGTDDKPVLLSSTDDELAKDSDEIRYWGGLQLDNSESVVLKNTELRYVKTPAISAQNSKLDSSNLIISSRDYSSSSDRIFIVELSDSDARFENLSISSAGTSIKLKGGDTEIDSLNFTKHGNDILIKSGAKAVLKHISSVANIFLSPDVSELELSDIQTGRILFYTRYNNTDFRKMYISDSDANVSWSGILRFSDTDYSVKNTSFKSIGRAVFNNSSINLQNTNLRASLGGWFFENSEIVMNDVSVSSYGNNKVSTWRASESAGASFVKSKAQLKNVRFIKNDKVALYAKDSELVLDNVTFEDNDENIIDIDSQIEFR